MLHVVFVSKGQSHADLNVSIHFISTVY